MNKDKGLKKMKPNKLKIIGLLLICTLFVITGFSIIEGKPLIRWGVIIFFGLGVVIFIIQLLSNSTYLKFHKNQIEIRSLYKSNFIKKKEIAKFGIATVPIIYLGHRYLDYNKKAVGFNFIESSSLNSRLSKFNKSISHYRGMLPDNYGYKPEKLAEILNDWLNYS